MATELALTGWDTGAYEFHKKLGNFVQYFQINLPSNGHGVPMQLVNPMLLAPNLLKCENTDDVSDEALDSSIMVIDFDDGLPLVEGTPIWERFDGEKVEYYKLFKEYREMLYNSGSRAIAKLAEMANVAGKYLHVLAKAYHWQLRCKAYDVFMAMERARKRQMEVEKLESKHARASDIMLEQALSYLDKHPEQLNAKVAVQMIQLAVKTGRLALGLNPEKPGAGDTQMPSIQINQTANVSSGAEHQSPGESGQGSHPPGTQDLSQLQSILHILDKSGALDKAKVVDAEYSVVDDDSIV